MCWYAVPILTGANNVIPTKVLWEWECFLHMLRQLHHLSSNQQRRLLLQQSKIMCTPQHSPAPKNQIRIHMNLSLLTFCSGGDWFNHVCLFVLLRGWPKLFGGGRNQKFFLYLVVASPNFLFPQKSLSIAFSEPRLSSKRGIEKSVLVRNNPLWSKFRPFNHVGVF